MHRDHRFSGTLLSDIAYASCLWTAIYIVALYTLEHTFWVRRADLDYDTLWNFHYLVTVPSIAIAGIGAVVCGLQLLRTGRDWRFAPLAVILVFIVHTQDRTLLRINDYVLNLLRVFDLYERIVLPFCALILLISSLRWFVFRRRRAIARRPASRAPSNP